MTGDAKAASDSVTCEMSSTHLSGPGSGEGVRRLYQEDEITDSVRHTCEFILKCRFFFFTFLKDFW